MAGLNEITCLNKNCSISSEDERLIVCWICHGLCHFKCSGLPVLVAESLNKHKGLHWCCNGCKKTGVDFYRFFHGSKSQFLEIQNKISELSKQVNVYGKMFDDYLSLKNLSSPPQSSPKRRKSARNTNKGASSQNITPNCSFPPDSANSIQIVNEYNPPDDQTKSNYESVSKSNAVKVNILPISNNPITNPDETASSSNINPIPNSFNVETTSASNPNESNLESNSSNVCNNFTPIQLSVIPPRKFIFISRFTCETSINDIDCYIKYKLNFSPDISIKKFSYSEPRSITSFKLTVPFDLYEQIIDPDFWPLNTYVREFRNTNNSRLSNGVRLPSADINNSKN